MKKITLLPVVLLMGSVMISPDLSAQGRNTSGTGSSSTASRQINTTKAVTTTSKATTTSRPATTVTNSVARPSTSSSTNLTKPSAPPSTVRPGGTTTKPGGTTPPNTSTTRPGGTTTKPGGTTPPNTSTTRPGGTTTKPGGTTPPNTSTTRPGGSPTTGTATQRPGTPNTRPSTPPPPPPTSYKPNYNYRPPRPHTPPTFTYYRPTPPPSWRPIGNVPNFNTILGVTLGTIISNTVNSWINSGYRVTGYTNNEVYLNNVDYYNVNWPNATMYYNNGYLQGSVFSASTIAYDPSRYNYVYNVLSSQYGAPVSTQNLSSGGMSCTWWGYNNSYITLSFYPEYISGIGTRYFTTLSTGN